MSGMVAFLAGLGGGYLQAQDKTRKQKQEDEDRADRKADREFMKSERDRTVAIRNRLGDAAAPVSMESVMAKPDTADNRDVGTPGTELIDTGSRRVGQQTFAPDQLPQAQAAVQAANTPQAQTTRMADVLARSGDPVAAQQLRTGARQEQVGQMQLDEAQRTALNRAYDDSLNSTVKSWEDLPTFVNDSKHDGQGGGLKIAVKPGADGKTVQIHRMNADGSTTPTGLSFGSDATGLMQAKAFISKGLSTSDKLNHLYQQSQSQRADAQQQETVRHNRAVEGIAADKTAANIEIAGMRAAAAAAKAGAGNGAMTMADLKDGHKAIASTLNADYKSQIDAEMDPAKAKAIKTARETETAMVQRLYTGATNAGMVMTPEQAIAAFRTGEVGKQQFKTKDGGTATVDVIRVNGRVIPLIDEPGIAAGAPAAPAPGLAAARPPTAKPGPMQAAAAPATAAPAGPVALQPTGDAALNAIQQRNVASMAPLNDAITQARAQLAAVAKSGDPAALSRYAQALQQAINARNAKAGELFGNGASQYLESLGQQ